MARAGRAAAEAVGAAWREALVQLTVTLRECAHCKAPGVSVVTLLTGLSSGEASAQLKLAAAYCGSAKS